MLSTRARDRSRLLALASCLFMAACSSAPAVPEGAVSLGDDVFVQPVRPGVWRHVSFRWYPATGPFPSNGLIVRSDRGAALIDTAWNPEQTATILDWAESNVGPIQAVFITHAHDDRMGGLAEVHRRGVRSVALRATAERAAKAGGPEIEEAVASGSRLESYGFRGEIFFPGAAHTADNAVVYLDEPRVLAGTCMVRSAAAQSLGNLEDADVDSWPDTMRSLQKRYPGAEVVVPGHGTPGGPELLQHTLQLLANRSD